MAAPPRGPFPCAGAAVWLPTRRDRPHERARAGHLCSRNTPELLYFYLVALSIKSDEADRLARQLASETGETLTEAVVTALQERLDREHARRSASMRRRLALLAADVATLPVADDRTPDQIIRYDDAGLPR